MKDFKNILIAGIFSLLAITAIGQADEVMLVEYVDWNSGSGLALKIYNPTDANIDLSTYQIQIYNNGNTSPNSTGNLSGTLAPEGTAIAANSQYASACSGSVDIVLSLSGVNDEDVVTLARNGEVIDAIGAIGYTGNYQINGTVVNQSLKWVKVIREEFNCIRYTEHNGLGSHSWPTNPGTNLLGWNVLPVSCLDPSVGYSISNAIEVVDTTICAGDSVFFNNEWILQTGTYTSTNASAFNCDTIWNLQLEVLGTDITQLSETICPGDSIFLGGLWQTQPGTYTDTIQDPSITCYSLVETTVSFPETQTVYEYISLCQGDSVLIEEAYISSPGTYNFTGQSGSDPCMVNYVYEISVNETVYQSTSFISCEPYTYGGQTYSSSITLTDTLQYVQGCDSIIKEISILIQPMEIEISGPAGMCSGEPLFLEATASQAPVWNTGDTSYSIIDTPVQSQWYWAEVSNESCSARDSVYVEVSNIEINMEPQISLDYGESESVNLIRLEGYPISIEWTPEDAGIDVTNPFNPVFSATTTTAYTAVATDQYGCSHAQTIFIEVIDPTIIVPNIITPNNDGFNDLLVIQHLPEKNHLQIYNRWGTQVFQASPYLNDWDGSEQDLSQGQFTYILTMHFGEQQLNSTGTITILK